MTISYNWLCEYLPVTLAPEKLSQILTSIGLEVESMEMQESVKGGLKGLVVGEVLTCVKHPEAEKLSLTTVNIGGAAPLSIVCGAPNVAAGQKVIVAPIGTTIYPVNGEPMTMKKAKIRGQESEGMICAEDEIGLGTDHNGIKILPSDTPAGMAVAELFETDTDYIFEIGLTPNRMDAMSHLGVARDVCAWLSYHQHQPVTVSTPLQHSVVASVHHDNFSLTIANSEACQRYTGILIQHVTVGESPDWLKKRLQSIGQKPINNIVDITNFILHETGQPLHAFDADQIFNSKVVIRLANEGETLTTLDDKNRTLRTDDLLIADDEKAMCLAGVYGGLNSGVQAHTKNIFLESARFHPSFIRSTSLHHDLRTDAAARFEKGVDISQTLAVAIRAAKLIEEIAGGNIVGQPLDIYPNPKPHQQLNFSLSYLQKLSGKHYESDSVIRILQALGFGVTQHEQDTLVLTIPYHKTDVHIPADIVEEIMRIDGLDNVLIPDTIRIAPSVDKNSYPARLREKIAGYLVGRGLHEVFTNSITNSNFYSQDVLQHAVLMMNSLSSELNMLRPDMLRTGLQVINHNLNRKNLDLQLFEWGKTYSKEEEGKFQESMHLTIYLTGQVQENGWNTKSTPADYFHLKGLTDAILQLSGVKKIKQENINHADFAAGMGYYIGKNALVKMGKVSGKLLKSFDIKQEVYYADIQWDLLVNMRPKPVQYREISKYPAVHRDLALVVDKKVSYSQIEQIALSQQMQQLKHVKLFDLFESEKLGAGKKSMAVSFTFQDETKTMTDTEIDKMMATLTQAYAKNIEAEIRK